MSTQSKTVAKRRTLSLVGTPRPDRASIDSKLLDQGYQIEEKKQLKTAVPFNSTLSIAVHIVTWFLAAVYFVQRFRSPSQESSSWVWAIYFCEVGMVLQELHSAIEISFSMFGPSKTLEHPQYVLRGTKAPKVHVLVTVCGESVDVIMDTVAAGARQDYPPDRFQVFVLDDAADKNLMDAVRAFNSTTKATGTGYQDVVYHSRQKTPGQRHYYKSGNLRSGLEFSKSFHGGSEFFAALDADMVSEKDWLSRTVPHLIKNADFAIVSPPQMFYNILDDDALAQDSNTFCQLLEPSRDYFGCSQCSGSGYVMRRAALDSIGGWPLANIGEDILCSYLLQEKGWKSKYIPDEVQYGLAPDSFHSYISQRIRWTYGSLLTAQHFRMFLPYIGRGGKLTPLQRAFSMSSAIKAYIPPVLLASILALPTCLLALQTGKVHQPVRDQSVGLVLACYIFASTWSKKLVYYRLGSRNVSNMSANRLWTSPFNAYCTLKSFVSDPGNTGFKVSGTFASPADERSAIHRKPLVQRMSSLTMLLYTTYWLAAMVALSSLMLFAAYQRMTLKTRQYLYTGAALRLVDVVLAASVPVRYMMFPPTVPERRELLKEDESGVFRAKKSGWTKRDGGSQIKLPLQIAIMLLFDWL